MPDLIGEEPEHVVIPALLRAARGAYGDAVRSRLAEAGFDDLPRNGPYVLGGIADSHGTTSTLVRDLRISKQAASQLIDTLVVRGYMTRREDPLDRRRMTIDLTERGHAAAALVRLAVDATDADLAAMISPDELSGLHAGLIALAEIRARMDDELPGSGSPDADVVE